MRKLSSAARLSVLLVIFSFVLTACGGSTTGNTGGSSSSSSSSSSSGGKTTNIKVTLVTDIGGLNDNGFNQLSYQGYTKARNELGFQESVIQTQSEKDYVNNLTQAAQKSDLVIAVGFLMQAPLDKVAKQFPNKKFGIIDGCAQDASGNCDKLPNVAPLGFAEQEAGCLVGAMAGQMELDGKGKISKLSGNNTISAVGGLSIPPVNRYIAGYQYCAKKVNPNVSIVVGYSQDFSNPAKCKDAALGQINQHKSDIIFQVAGGCGIGSLDAAKEKNVFGIGVDADQSKINANVMTSALKRVDTAVYQTIKQTADNKFTSTPATFNLKVDGVGYGTVSGDVPADAKAAADKLADQIKAGSITVPTEVSK